MAEAKRFFSKAPLLVKRFGPWGSGKRFGAGIITRPAAAKQEALLQAGLSAARRRR